MQSHKKFAFDVGITFIASMISMLLGFIITVLLGRYLGAGDLGLYQMASTIYGIAVLIAGFGIPGAIIKYVAEYKKDRRKTNIIISTGVITSLLLGIGFSILFYLSSGMFETIFKMPELSSLLRILSLVFPFALVGGTLLGFLNGLREMTKFAIATVIQSFLMVVVSVIMILWGYGVSGAVSGVVLSSVGSCIYLIWISRQHFEITFDNYIETTKEILRFGTQIFGANAINLINYQADTIIIGYFLTATDVGYYGVAVGFSKIVWIIPQAIQTITYPVTSEYWTNKNHAAIQSMIEKSMKYTACIVLPIGLGVGFFAKDIITLIFGKEFVSAVFPLQILIAGTVTYCIFKVVGGAVTGAGRPDLSLKIVAISATINIMLNVTLIPYFGIVGAGMATTASLVVGTLLGLFLTIKILKVKIDFKWYVKVFGITFLAILIFSSNEIINNYLFGTMILCFYSSTIIKLLLTNEDRAYFKGLISMANCTLKKK